LFHFSIKSDLSKVPLTIEIAFARRTHNSTAETCQRPAIVFLRIFPCKNVVFRTQDKRNVAWLHLQVFDEKNFS
jgi:hypothetical protein